MFNHDKLRELIAKAPISLKEAYNELDAHDALKEKEFDAKRHVESCLNFPPAPQAQYLYRTWAETSLREGKEDEAINHFILMQALTFKHQFLIQQGKRQIKTISDFYRGKNIEEKAAIDIIKDTENQIRMMMFAKDETIENILKTLPETWTIVQISTINSHAFSRFKQTQKDLSLKEGNPNLCFIRLSNDGTPGQIRTVVSKDESCVVPYLQEIQTILKEQLLLLKEPGTDKRKYWNLREVLNQRMLALVESAETAWVGSTKGILLGKLKNPSALNILSEISQEVLDLLNVKVGFAEQSKLNILLSGSGFLTLEQVFKELMLMFPRADEDSLYNAATLIHGYSETKLNLKSEPREPVILILDPEIQSLPWESLPCMRDSKQPVSRIASLQFLSCLWQVHKSSRSSVVQTGLDADSVFYMINPDKSLPKTQERLESVVNSFQEWEGLAGRAPEPGQLAKALGQKDAYVYSGHGDGTRYITNSEIEKLKIRGVSLLLGCSSGELKRAGRNTDPHGVVQSYLFGTSPAVAGFLWPITDADVDKWTIEFLEYWLTGKEENLLQAIADKRNSFKYFVNSAALVVYGLPVAVKSKK